MTSTLNMLGAYFTSVGTTVHEVVQNYLAPSGRFLADWKCPVCRKERKFTTNSECCDSTMSYHEVQINFKGVVGHIDAIFQDRDGKYWILDFKTCTMAGSSYKQKSPGASYKEQVETYAYTLYRQYGIKVEGVILMFIPRDNPTVPTLWIRLIDKADFKTIHNRIKAYKKMHQQALHAVTLAEALALAEHGRCKGEWCKTCRSGISLKKQLKAAHKIGAMKKHLPLNDLK